MSLPYITIIGTLGKLETRHIPSGKEVTKFQIECSEKNSKGEWENLYIKGEVWEQASQFLNKYFKNGSVAVVTGKLVTNVYDKNDGTKAYENKLLFPSIGFVPKDKSDNQETQRPQQKQEPVIEYEKQNTSMYPEIDIDEDEIPFSEVTAPIHNADKFYVKCISCETTFDTDKYDLDLEHDGDICGFCPKCNGSKIFFEVDKNGAYK